jgi:hypothetical protein
MTSRRRWDCRLAVMTETTQHTGVKLWWRRGRSGWWMLRQRASARLRSIRHLGGDFDEGEASARATDLTSRWFAAWPGFGPAPRERARDEEFGDRWVRFHSLPQSKRYADTASEAAIILARHQAILTELTQGDDSRDLVVIAEDWHALDLAGGWTKKHLRGAWPWIRHVDPSEFDPESRMPNAHYFWTAPPLPADGLDALLALAANDIARIMITDRAMTWMYMPYDGGADVWARTTRDRDRLRASYADWLPADTL